MVKAVDGDASPVSANTPAAASSSGATPKQPSSLGFQTPKLPPPLLAANASTEESKSLDSPMAALPSTRTSSTIAAVGGLAAFEASIDNDIGALGLDTLSPPNAGSSFRIGMRRPLCMLPLHLTTCAVSQSLRLKQLRS